MSLNIEEGWHFLQIIQAGADSKEASVPDEKCGCIDASLLDETFNLEGHVHA